MRVLRAVDPVPPPRGRVGYTPAFRTRSFQSTVSLTTLGEGEALAVARGVLGAVELPHEVTAALMDKAEGVQRMIGLMTCHLFAPTLSCANEDRLKEAVDAAHLVKPAGLGGPRLRAALQRRNRVGQCPRDPQGDVQHYRLLACEGAETRHG